MKITTPITPLAGTNFFGLNDSTEATTVWGWLSLVSGAVSAYHGGKRNNGSVWQTVKWGALGTIFPIITPIVAITQGYAKPLPKHLSGARRNPQRSR